jgi:zinc D-Ala-D-Ala carboxypeptidase
MNLSKHFTYTEFIRSETAVRRGIENIPDAECITNAVVLCNRVLEPIRDLVGKPIRISSGYRCPELNTLIGGSETSQHMRGEAVDFEVEGVNAPDVFWAILDSDIPYDQLIGEFGEWIHVSYRHDPRHEALVALKNDAGVTEYRRITTKGDQ